MKTACVKCRCPLPPPAATGRPKTYCSSACRRAAEFEIRRIGRHIEGLEQEIQHLKMYGALSCFAAFDAPPKDAVKKRASEIRRLEARLRLLLADQQVKEGTNDAPIEP